MNRFQQDIAEQGYMLLGSRVSNSSARVSFRSAVELPEGLRWYEA